MLWALRRIERLAPGKSHREEVVTLSRRFTIPSKETSWLAIPQEELQRFKQEKLRAEMDLLGNRLAHEYERGRYNSETARELRAKLAPLCKQANQSMGSYLSQHLNEKLYRLAAPLAEMTVDRRGNSREAHQLRNSLNRLCQMLEIDPQTILAPQMEQAA